jgi:PAS domain S-box-containing protein
VASARPDPAQPDPACGDSRPLSLDLLCAIRRAVAAASTPENAEELTFRLGRAWGESLVPGRAGDPTSVRREIERAAVVLEAEGLAAVTIERATFDREGSGFAVAGRVRCIDAADSSRDDGAPAALALAMGVLTGASARLTGLDLVCSEPRADGELDGADRTFEIRPAHASAPQIAPARALAGKARFFLDSLGASFGEGDIALADLVEGASDAIILIDNDDIVRYWNRGAEEMFLYRRDEVVGRRVGFIVPQDLIASGELAAIKQQLAERGALSNLVTRRVRKDGVELWISLTRTLLHDHAGRAVGSTAILRDITAQRRAEADLQGARQLAILGELAAKVAHEIKNPLAGIFAAIQILERTLESGDPRRRVFADVAREIKRLDDTVQDLLRFARPLPAKLIATPLASFVRDALAPHRLQPELAPHTIEISVPEDLVATIDARLMSQAITNLVINAGQAMERPGTIWIDARETPTAIEIEVGDSGPGVPHELRETIFDPFFTTKSRGTGLGLAIARKNVQAHGGSLGLSERRGGGALFRIALPRRSERTTA